MICGDLTGKHILVTGAASGIGRRIALDAASAGATVTVTSRRADKLEELSKEVKGPGSVNVEPQDLADSSAVVDWLTRISATTKLDGIAHCAGQSFVSPLRTTRMDMASDLFAANLLSTLALLRGFASRKVSNDDAAFVALSSAAAHEASPGLATYAATKAAVESLVRTSALELRDRRLRVNAVAPGYVETEMMEKSKASLPGFDAIMAKQFLGMIPVSEVSALVLFLLSPLSRSITGTVLVVDAGLTL
jgi:NAD(P)-dependent dehydrogenase (short-subunit alcohol dehydrogenase family)